jgi:hypothetical protein
MNFDFLDIFGKDYCDNINKDVIKQFEENYEIAFPDDYKEFLLRFNGGSLYDFESSILKENFVQEVPSLNNIEHLINEKDWYFYTFYKNYLILPIATDNDSIEIIFIGVGKENNGNIYFCNTFLSEGNFTLSEDNLDISDGKLHKIANSFKEFITSFILK